MRVKDIVKQTEKFEELEDLAQRIETALKTVGETQISPEPMGESHGLILSTSNICFPIITFSVPSRLKVEIVDLLKSQLESIRAEQEALEV